MSKKIKISCFLDLLAFVLIIVVGLIYLQDISNRINQRKTYRLGFDKPGEYSKFFHDISVPPGSEEIPFKSSYRINEFNKALSNRRRKATGETYQWIQRGPGNVGGRTRELIIHQADETNKTWFAASASGGVWKTNNAGESWINLTPDLPNLATSTIAMSPASNNTIYIGTGEGYGAVGMVAGDGMFVSRDTGYTWTQLASTAGNEDFRYVNKMVIDPDNDSILVVTTNAGIFKSIDAGNTWSTVYKKGYQVQDIIYKPGDFNIQYAAANSLGILKSIDAGDSWEISSNGIGAGLRFAVAISEMNPQRVYTSVEVPGYITDIYLSVDEGENWHKFNDEDGGDKNFLSPQGWFNNEIAVHPFNDDIVFIGGVSLGKVEFDISFQGSEPQVIRVDTVGTGAFLSFVNFGGTFLGGGFYTSEDDEDDELDPIDLNSADWSSVKIYFGPGRTQKAHRFTVPAGEGASVPKEDYTYNDYVDVPFEVWDIDNNRQLMVSFRDQERDTAFNLIKRDPDDDISGREYIYVNAVPYNASLPSTDIAQQGGHNFKLLYFIWPALRYNPIEEDEIEWQPDSLPDSEIDITYGTYSYVDGTPTVLADYTKNKELHVDHHDLKMIITNPATQSFTILDANDGGLGISTNGGFTWSQIDNGYYTTQFYGVAKRPGKHEYIGGMQDNGTWQSPVGEYAGSTSEYDDKISGDGFEVLWHSVYSHRIIGSSYNNILFFSNDEGENWFAADKGLPEGPFLTRLSHSRQNPDVIFAVGAQGVFKHPRFGMGKYSWELIPIDKGWSPGDYVTSQHNVEVSLADPDVIWAGSGMYADPDLHIFLSSDQGESFDSVPNYKAVKMGWITGIATHPKNPAEAFILFSLPEKPKILRTYNYGGHWDDISGFGANDTSDNGFPDVRVYSLLVLPYDTTILWAGTEIGLFESVDNGDTWYYADNGLPAVSIWQMEVIDQHIVVATHGRGIYTLDLNTVSRKDKAINSVNKLLTYPNPAKETINLQFQSDYRGVVKIAILTIDGKEVSAYSSYKSGIEFIQNINIESLSSGSYFVRIQSGGEIYSNQIAVQ